MKRFLLLTLLLSLAGCAGIPVKRTYSLALMDGEGRSANLGLTLEPASKGLKK